ncbi:hypothetical protein BJV77DRAFT_700237 [Russula vinacea]|nr:hypothetical protein BJV77DRAFT_700237 [Russula vinacea]
MTTDAWQTFSNFATTAGITTVAYSGAKGVIASYQTYASPTTSLTQSEKKLERVRSRLQELSPRRREEIEIVIRSNASDCRSLKDLEEQLDGLLDMFCRLSKRYEEATFAERHFPYSQFRNRVSKLEHLAKALLNDTLKTTVPFVDDIEYDPTSGSRSLDAFSTPSAPFPDADAIPLSRV